MNDQLRTELKPQAAAAIRAELHELARLLREARHLEPPAKGTLADLLDELGDELDAAAMPSTHTAHLATTLAELARSLHEQHPPGLLAAARDRLDEAVLRAEVAAPVATGVARRFIDSLANMGI